MMRIEVVRVSACADGDVFVEIEMRDGEHSCLRKIKVDASVYADLGIRKGRVLTCEEFDGLEYESSLGAARASVNRILACGVNSERGLETKLLRKGFSAEISRKAVGEAVQNGFLDEKRDMERLISRYLESGYGKGYVIGRLLDKGYGYESVKEAFLTFSDFDYVENCRRMIKKKFGKVPAGYAERQPIVRSLARYGYTADQISEATRSPH